ncbi:aspartate/glutamate racemase family protein [Sphingopyxis fribergensis]
MRLTVGVLGGMGPAAAIAFQHMLLEATPARDDADHLHVITDNDPSVPSRIRALVDGDGESPEPAMRRMARRLERAGAEVLVMPCNTAHHYRSRVAEAVGIPFLDMIGVATGFFGEHPERPQRIGLLASPAVELTRLYEEPLAKHGMKAAYPDGEQSAALLAIIRGVKAGGASETLSRDYAALASAFAPHCDALLVACTELSILTRPDVAPPLADALSLLAKATVLFASSPERDISV